MENKILDLMLFELRESESFIEVDDYKKDRETFNGLLEYLESTDFDKDLIREIESQCDDVATEAERQGFYNGFKAAFDFIKSLEQGGKKMDNTIKELKMIQTINPMKVVRMALVPDKKGQQVVSIWEEVRDEADLRKFEFKITKGYEIHAINELLRSMDTGLDVEFQTYKQYGELLNQVMNLLDQMNKATA